MAYPKGRPNPNAGRPPGALNKQTMEIKEAFRNLIEQNTPNMIAWMEQIAAVDPAKALSICADLAEFVVPKLARSEQKVEHSGNLTVSWVSNGDAKSSADN